MGGLLADGDFRTSGREQNLVTCRRRFGCLDYLPCGELEIRKFTFY